MAAVLKNNFKILIVEDDEDDQFFLKKIFTELLPSAEIIQAYNGIECMDYLEANTETLPDLITMDLNMPLVNGLEATKKIKTNERLSSIPVIVMSTSDREANKLSAIDSGANDYCIKAVEYDKLKLVVNEIVKNWLTERS